MTPLLCINVCSLLSPLTPPMSPTLLTLVCSLLALASHSAGYNYGGALVMGAMQGEDLGVEDMGNIWNNDQVKEVLLNKLLLEIGLDALVHYAFIFHTKNEC